MKICLAIPSHDTVPFLFAYDLAGLCAFTAAIMPDDMDFGIHGISGTYVHQARHDLMGAAYAKEADYVLWIDSDMRFPRDALVRLLKHNLPVVGINYATRGVPSGFVAIKSVGIGDAGVRCETREDSTGLEEVEGIGFGLVLVKMSALANMPNPKDVPWFQNKYMGGGHWMGEDIHFCQLLRESGERIFVDHDLSKSCAHIGQFEYLISHAQAEIPEEVAA